MDDSTWERWSALGGIAFVVLVALSAFLPGDPPKVTDSAAKIATFFADKESELRWSAFIGGLAFLAVFWWAGAVWRLMRRGEGGVPRLAILALGGLVFANVMAGLAGLINSAVAMRTVAGIGGAQTAKTFYVIGWVIGSAVTFGVAAFLFGFSAVIIRSGVLPRARVVRRGVGRRRSGGRRSRRFDARRVRRALVGHAPRVLAVDPDRERADAAHGAVRRVSLSVVARVRQGCLGRETARDVPPRAR